MKNLRSSFYIWALLVNFGISSVYARIKDHPKLKGAPDESVVVGDYIVLFESLDEFTPPKLSQEESSTEKTAPNNVKTVDPRKLPSNRPSVQQTLLDTTIPSKYVEFDCSRVMNGYIMRGVPDDVMRNILDNNLVKEVYEEIRADLTTYETDLDMFVAQQNPVWNLDRIDQRRGTDGEYEYDFTGAGVHVFIIDSGILDTHPEFVGRYTDCVDYSDDNDCNLKGNHGTHVAGTALGTTYGVAKNAILHDLKWYSESLGSGTFGSIIMALEAVTATKMANPTTDMVVNISAGGGVFEPVNTAAANCVNLGVVVAVSAGNDNGDACQKSPAAEPSVITVASTTRSDARSSFSNFGSCVDIFAPGSLITSASRSGGTTILSGTSMSSPHIAGIAALLFEEGLDPFTEIFNIATPNVISNTLGSPNLFAFNGNNNPDPRPQPAPAPAPTSPAPDDCRHPFAARIWQSLFGEDDP